MWEQKLRGLRRTQGHDGYPNDRVFLKDGSVNAIVWDPATRLMKNPDVHDFGTRCVEKLGENQYKFTLSHSQEYHINPGDYITVSHCYALHVRHVSLHCSLNIVGLFPVSSHRFLCCPAILLPIVRSGMHACRQMVLFHSPASTLPTQRAPSQNCCCI